MQTTCSFKIKPFIESEQWPIPKNRLLTDFIKGAGIMTQLTYNRIAEIVYDDTAMFQPKDGRPGLARILLLIDWIDLSYGKATVIITLWLYRKGLGIPIAIMPGQPESTRYLLPAEFTRYAFEKAPRGFEYENLFQFVLEHPELTNPKPSK